MVNVLISFAVGGAMLLITAWWWNRQVALQEVSDRPCVRAGNT